MSLREELERYVDVLAVRSQEEREAIRRLRECDGRTYRKGQESIMVSVELTLRGLLGDAPNE